ncbi:TetR/AcrR family transcriptional regulator [Ornithinibacillus californiensis]|uniref:TetR/AcrR family transcriptional regulator n=1 Tax=Ornithinibacillus californiensis TaxID=161536 RepID=UPI00064DCDFB|nr:TetR/AcrR family transcriptional regulator [Ornithinibacillus californiensis]
MSKKQLIMEKALELFAKQGFEATSVQQITDYCGISKGAFYLSFKSKDELILAIIDHFMEQISIDIDYTVRNVTTDRIMYHFFHTIFLAFSRHANFAKILMKEQTHSLNSKLLTKMQYYDRRTDQTILSIIENVYGNKIKGNKFDLVFAIKGLMNGYANFILFNEIEMDLELISNSLVEKTEILAKHVTIPFITEEMAERFHTFSDDEYSAVDLLHMVEDAFKEADDKISKESLTILKEQLQLQTYSPAILNGLIENIYGRSENKRLGYLLKKYFQLTN